MAEEPRRSGRATKGQHKNASSSPAPQPKPTKKSKPAKKSLDPQPEDYDDEEETIRCICGNDNPKDKRAFIGCDACSVWQHNVCMGMPDDEDEVPDHYFCEKCGPDDHGETLQSLLMGEKIWEARNKIYQNEKKMSRNRKGKSAKEGWLKKDVPPPGAEEEDVEMEEPEEPDTGSKRKREEVTEELQEGVKGEEVEERSTRSSRQEKRRKSAMEGSADPETALVEIEKLPADRKKIAETLRKIIDDDLTARAKEPDSPIPEGETPQSLASHHAALLEYALKMNHEGTANPSYMAQFRTLNANLKKNKVLIARLLDGSLTADELSTMSSKDMASEELQKERAVMKEQLDRQAVAVQEEGPRYRRTHKGDELIEDENAMIRSHGSAMPAQPVRERTSVQVDADAGSPTAEGPQSAGSPMQTDQPPLRVDTKTTELPQRRSSSQQFDMNSIWARTAQSPTSASGPRPMQMPARRRSSVQPPRDQVDGSGTKEDADVDRMLQDDDDETYSPADYAGEDGIVWRGKLMQSGDGASPTVNARFVAGRDLSSTVSWRDLLPDRLSIDGRLQVSKAEEYLCSLQWSQSSDVSVLALTPYDDAEVFEAVFAYFKSRDRYAVVNKDKPPMVKDLYIIPVDAGQELPTHVGMLEFCRLKATVEEKCLLASFVVGRAPGTPQLSQGASMGEQQAGLPVNGHQHLPQHVRASMPGPSGSPLNANPGTFSPGHNNATPQPLPAYGAGAIPPTLYHPQQYPPPQVSAPPPGEMQQQAPPAPPAASAVSNPLVAEILGPLQHAPTALQVVHADPSIAREKLEHLKRILEDDPNARTDINALAAKLR